MKDMIISDIRNLFELENEDYYKPIRVGNLYSNNYIKSNMNIMVIEINNKYISIEKYLNKLNHI